MNLLQEIGVQGVGGGKWLKHKGEHKWFPQWTDPTINKVTAGEEIAVYPTIMNKIIGKIPVSSFHVTDIDSYKQLDRVRGKKKALSTFSQTKAGSPLGKGKGIQTKGGMAFHVEGFLLARSFDDLMSTPDKTGRRWVPGYKVFDGDHMILKTAIKKAKLDYDGWHARYEKIMKKYKGKEFDDTPWSEINKEAQKMRDKMESGFIRDFMDMQNKLMLKHKKDVVKSLASEDGLVSSWNEVLIYDTKIKEAFVLNRVGNKMYDKQKEDFEKWVGGKVTYGTPGQYKKWVTSKGGKIVV